MERRDEIGEGEEGVLVEIVIGGGYVIIRENLFYTY